MFGFLHKLCDSRETVVHVPSGTVSAFKQSSIGSRNLGIAPTAENGNAVRVGITISCRVPWPEAVKHQLTQRKETEIREM